MQADWITGGSRDASYNSTPSGWFDSNVFQDWFEKVAVPYFDRIRDRGPKVILGDNVPSHLNPNVIKKAEEKGIKFVFLPPNSTHLLQPLDVAVFRSLKSEWRKALTTWKTNEGRRFPVLPKWAVPQLLHRLDVAMEDKWSTLAKTGFRACGIYPFTQESSPTNIFAWM